MSSHDSRRRNFQLRLLFLLAVLLGVSIWRWSILAGERRPVDWTMEHHVLVCPLVPPGADLAGVETRLAGAGDALTEWMSAELGRWRAVEDPPVVFDIAPAQPVDSAPPRLPEAEDSFLTRWRETRAFLSWFEETADRFPEPWPGGSTVWVLVHPESEAARFADRHSVGTARGRRGMVFASDRPESWGNVLCVIAHETLHSMGAGDHRDDAGDIVWPDGYADPDRQPLHPQTRAEVMALGIPRDATSEYRVGRLADIVLGPVTALQVGWIEEAPESW